MSGSVITRANNNISNKKRSGKNSCNAGKLVNGSSVKKNGGLMVSNNRGGYRKCYGGTNTKYNINDIMSQYYGYFKKKNKK